MGIVDIVKARPQKNAYPDTYDNNTFGNINYYLLLAKKSISRFAPRFLTADIVKKMLASDDVVSNIATDIMLAEWRYDSNIGNKEGFRIQCALFSVLKFIRRIKNDKNGKNVNFNIDTETALLHQHNSVLLNGVTPEHLTIQKEEHAQLMSIIKRTLSDMEADCVILYYINNLSRADIARLKNRSRERIRQVLNNAMIKLTGKWTL